MTVDPAPGDTTKRLPPGHVIPLPVGSAGAAAAPPQEPLEPRRGPRTVGAYQVVRELARGGMGVVYVARDPRLGRLVAVKVLLAGAGAGEEDRARFRVEAHAAAALRHPSIVPVHELGEEGGRPFLVMELIDGESLHARVRREGPLDDAEAARAALSLAEGLAHAHGRGVLHRDVKPHNLLLSKDGRAILTDFGLAKVAEAGARSLTATGQVLGTPVYMAPEQARGDRRAIDARTDVYGAGATLYEALCGRPPFTGRSIVDVLEAVSTRRAPPPSRYRPGIDPELEAVCVRAMSPDPAARFETAGALADALRAWLAAQDAAGTRRPAARRRVRPASPALALSLVAAVAVVAAGAALVLDLGAASGERPDANVAPPQAPPGSEAPPAPAPPPSPAAPVAPAAAAPPGPSASPAPPPPEPAPLDPVAPPPLPLPPPAFPLPPEPPAPSRADLEAACARADALLAGVDVLEAPTREHLALCARAVDVAPEYGRALFLRGLVGLRLAERTLDRAEVRRLQDDALADLLRADRVAAPFDGDDLFLLRADLLFGQRRFAEAFPDLRRSHAARPDDPDLAFRLGVAAREAQAHTVAVEVLTPLAQRPGAAWQVHFQLGGALTSLRRWDEAIEAYRAADRVGPRAYWPIVRLGEVLLEASRVDEAADALARALAADADEPVANLGLARARLAQGRAVEARDLARRSLDGRPGHVGATLVLADALLSLGEREGARRVLAGALAGTAGGSDDARRLEERLREVELR